MKNPKAIFGIVLIVVGAILLFFSNYIADQVMAGKLQIQRGQQTVDTTNSLFSASPTTKPIGQALTSSGQRRIDAGRAEVSKYESLARTFQIAGVVFIVAGIGLLILSRRK